MMAFQSNNMEPHMIATKDIISLSILMKWIEENVTKPGDLREAAEWFIAMQYVEYWSENGAKDNACFILSGIPALTGNDDAAQDMIDEWWEDDDEEIAEFLLVSLKQHFGDKMKTNG